MLNLRAYLGALSEVSSNCSVEYFSSLHRDNLLVFVPWHWPALLVFFLHTIMGKLMGSAHGSHMAAEALRLHSYYFFSYCSPSATEPLKTAFFFK